jgi:hypothetical protein
MTGFLLPDLNSYFILIHIYIINWLSAKWSKIDFNIIPPRHHSYSLFMQNILSNYFQFVCYKIMLVFF